MPPTPDHEARPRRSNAAEGSDRNERNLEMSETGLTTTATLHYRAEVEPFEATAHDGTLFTVTHCWWDLQKSSITHGWFVMRTDLAATGKNRTVWPATPITDDGKITWPDGPQPPAWFTTAAEAMMVWHEVPPPPLGEVIDADDFGCCRRLEHVAHDMALTQATVDAAVAEALDLADTWDEADDEPDDESSAFREWQQDVTA